MELTDLIGDIGSRVIIIDAYHGSTYNAQGTIKDIKGKCVFVLEDKTTTGALSEYTLRKNGRIVKKGYSISEFADSIKRA